MWLNGFTLSWEELSNDTQAIHNLVTDTQAIHNLVTNTQAIHNLVTDTQAIRNLVTAPSQSSQFFGAAAARHNKWYLDT